MNDSLPHPGEGKFVTIVAVHQGEPLVTYGKVLVGKPNFLAVAIRVVPDELSRYDGAPVTVLYGDADHSMILRGRVSGTVGPDRLLVSTPDPPRVGERREFIRVDLSLDIRLDRAPDAVVDEGGLREWVDELSPHADDYRFREIEVDLSGSGARFVYPIVLKKEERVVFSARLPEGHARPLIHLPASVVRARPAKALDDAMEVAITFAALTEEESDLLNYVVFEE